MASYNVLIVSDGTGETANRMLKAAMLQFREDIVISRHSNVRTESQIREILQEASNGRMLVVHTFVTPELRDFIQKAAEEEGAQCIDLIGPIMGQLSSFFETSPEAEPGLLHRVDAEYFARIDAIEYAIRHDDGRCANDMDTADIILLGVSRTSKTPLSIYLAQEGQNVANIPIVQGMKIPDEVSQVDQEKIVGLSIDPERLAVIRRARLQQLGVQDSSYADMVRIKEELSYAHTIFSQSPIWPVIDVTGKSLEELAHEVLDNLFGKERGL